MNVLCVREPVVIETTLKNQLDNIYHEIVFSIPPWILSDRHKLFPPPTIIPLPASNDVQQELSGLGVSVYSQEEFEAGVLHQIDQEVGRRNAEQQKKFVLQEYGTVRQEIRWAVDIEIASLHTLVIERWTYTQSAQNQSGLTNP